MISPASSQDGTMEHIEVSDSSPVLLKLRGINKSFTGVRALREVNLEVRSGEIHALVGENGAGKSTLMAIASGALSPDTGTVEIGGQILHAASPSEARILGLGIVRQDPALLPDLTVAENMAIGVGYQPAGGLRGAAEWAKDQLGPWQMNISPHSRVEDLSVEQRFVVEIAKAISLRPQVLVLDEPTEHLSGDEVQRLFARVREIVAQGAAVVYISHRIPEVREIADRITVLRDGQTRGTFDVSSVDENQIVEKIIGRSLDTVFPEKGSAAGTVRDDNRLQINDLSGHGFHGINLTVKAGEIVGLAGVQGNGQTQLVRALAGLERSKGSVIAAGSKLRLGSNHASSQAGIVYVPADRHGEGVFLPLSVAENIAMKTLPNVSSNGFVSSRRITAQAKEQIQNLSIKTPTPETPISSLSGGNQQKVVLARTLLARPRILVAEEPTQGVDAGARVDIYRILREAADSGAAVLVLSSDGVELSGLCDRVVIMSRGTIVKELEGEGLNEAAITRAAVTSTSALQRDSRETTVSGRLKRFAVSNNAPAAILSLVLLGLLAAMGLSSGSFLSAANINNLLFLLAPLILVGIAQHIVVLGSGFDLSLGPLMGFLVVIASFWINDGGNIIVGLLIMLGTAIAVGLINGLLITRFNFSPVVATLAMFMAIQGLFLTFRSTPGGIISESVTEQIGSHIGAVPVVTLGAVLLAVGFELALRRTRWGVELRAVGSQKPAAERLGIRTRRTQVLSYVLASLLVFPAALIVMAQIGIGDGRPSVSYTLSSVTVVVLAGASIFGGRGSFLGVLAAAFLVQQVVSMSPFLGLSQAWSYWLPGLITIGAATLYSQLRQSKKAS